VDSGRRSAGAFQRLVFFEQEAIGLATPDQALYEQLTSEESVHLERAAALAKALGVTFSAFRARHESQASRDRIALVHVQQTMDIDVFRRQWTGAAVLHRSVLAKRL
jgi:hypothetical protein